MNAKCLNIKTYYFWTLEFENSFELWALTFDIGRFGSFDPNLISLSHIVS